MIFHCLAEAFYGKREICRKERIVTKCPYFMTVYLLLFDEVCQRFLRYVSTYLFDLYCDRNELVFNDPFMQELDCLEIIALM